MNASRTSTFILSAICLTLCLGFIKADKWITIQSKKFGYQVDFPKKPTEQSQDVDSEVGKVKLNMYIYDASEVAGDENLLYMSNCTQHPAIDANALDSAQLADFFDRTVGGVAKGVNGELLSQKKIMLDKHEGREITVGYEENKNTITMRLFVVDNKIFMLQAIAATDKSPNKSATRFFDSFKLTK
ncbi:MAG: hypothetical protein JWM14_91 [Chitinophagaceae bacterium]|nr:hypothetical protein [Chitinophagaceae bacterium]